jgi:hypothetical protein
MELVLDVPDRTPDRMNAVAQSASEASPSVLGSVNGAPSRAMDGLAALMKHNYEALLASADAAGAHTRLIGSAVTAHMHKTFEIALERGRDLAAAKTPQERFDLSWTTMNDMFEANSKQAASIADACVKAFLDISRPFNNNP